MIDAKIANRYLDLLEQGFVRFTIYVALAGIYEKKSLKSKRYFHNHGIRNALIANFNEIAIRDHVGKLSENFIFIERPKKRLHYNIYTNNYLGEHGIERKLI